jgi:hypothetical protein
VIDRLAGSVAILAIALLLAVEVDAVYSSSITGDETADIAAGASAVFHGEYALFLEHPPLAPLISGATLRAAGARPRSADTFYEAARSNPLVQWGWGERFIFEDNRDFRIPFARPGVDSVVTAARLPLVFFPALLALVAFLWGKSRFGPRGGLLALALVLTYPDLLGHGALATTDVPFVALAILAAFALDRYDLDRGRGWLVLLGVATGLACGAKLWGLFLVPALVVAGRKHPRGLLLAGGIAFLVLWALYLGAFPITACLRGVDALRKHHTEIHEAVLLGHATRGHYYLFVAGLLKLPLGTLALLGVTIALARREVLSPLHLPAVLIFLANSFLAEPYGTRYLLPVVSFLLVSAGRLAPWATTRGRVLGIVLALGANAIGVAHEHPWHVSAMNLLMRPLAGAPWRALDNSNTDIGQGLKALARWEQISGITSLVVVPRGATPFLRPRESPDQVGINYDTRLARLDAYGVGGRVEPHELGEAVFHPRKGVVYAVSVHVLARALIFETDEPLYWPSGARGPAHMTLGVTVPPVATVGGVYEIFDLRSPPP